MSLPSGMDQTASVLSLEAEHSLVPSGENLTKLTAFLSPRSFFAVWPEAPFQSLPFPSSAPVPSHSPAGLTAKVCPAFLATDASRSFCAFSGRRHNSGADFGRQSG